MLTDRRCRSARDGRHSDEKGLYLVVRGNSRTWSFMWKRGGRKALRKEMGLGAYPDVSLAEAREWAKEARQDLRAGRDPRVARDQRRNASSMPTFGEVATELIASLEHSWKNSKHRDQWRGTVLGVGPKGGKAANDYCAPLRKMKVDQIATPDVLDVLKPLWQKVPETAARLRGRIERVLDAAKAKGMRSGENPAAWRGNLAMLLPKRRKLATRGHHRALPYGDLPGFMTRLRASQGAASAALEFIVLTAARTGEVTGMQWPEIDWEGRIWSVPPERMKGGRPHRVPLSDRAFDILRARWKVRRGPYAFPGLKRGRPLSGTACEAVLERMGVADVATVHGFRSSFKDWCSETTTFPNHVSEMALAHVIESDVERAYRRGDLFDKRRRLMAAWATYCTEARGNVVQMRRKKS